MFSYFFGAPARGSSLRTMAVEVKLPRLGQGMEAGTIVRWLKTEGDQVARGEPLYELDTDKVTQEVEAEAEGVLLEIVVFEGEVAAGAGRARRRAAPMPERPHGGWAPPGGPGPPAAHYGPTAGHPLVALSHKV